MIEAPGAGGWSQCRGSELAGGQMPALETGPDYVPRIRGSSASRSPSPM